MPEKWASEGAVSHNVVNYQQLSIARSTKYIFMLTIILSNYNENFVQCL